MRVIKVSTMVVATASGYSVATTGHLATAAGQLVTRYLATAVGYPVAGYLVATAGYSVAHYLWVKEEWDAIPVNYYRNLIKSMPRRVQAILEANGSQTKY
ncbi:hypothetical protein G9A89_005120 [Geosiphon pyriformis]|nr:hypothetical protein G9A89_005120 [Geosiphon pyriformis]